MADILDNSIIIRDSFLRRFDVVENINISINVNSMPTMTMKVVSDKEIADIIKRSSVTIISLFNVSNMTESMEVIEENVVRITYDIDFEYHWKKKLEEEIIVGYGETKDSYTVGQLCKLNKIRFYSPKDPENKVDKPFITTINSEIIKLANKFNAYIVYLQDIIKIEKQGGLGIVPIKEENILSERKEEHINNDDNFVYLPHYLEFTKPVEDEENVNQPIIFDQAYSEVVEIENNPDDARTAPVSGLIRSLDMNFDISGETKTIEKTIYEGDRIKSKWITTYGYAYQSDEVANYNPSLQMNEFQGYYENYWKIVESCHITYLYEKNYYIGYDKTGYKLDRFNQESEGFELLVVKLSGSRDPEIINEAQQYKFRLIPINEYERYDLEAFYNYYEDAKPTYNDLFIEYDYYNDKTGKFEKGRVKNEAYITPMFIKKKLMYSNCFDWMLVPESIRDYVGHVLTCGEEKKEIQTIEIRPSKNTRGLGVGQSTLEDYYEEYYTIASSQDAGFKNHIKQTETSVVQGRPSPVDVFPTVVRVENNEDATNISNELNPKVKYIVSSQADDIIEPQDTVTIPNVKDINEALEILQKQINENNRYQSNKTTLTLFANRETPPVNQKIRYNYGGKLYTGITKSIDYNLQVLGNIRGSTILKGFVTITLYEDLTSAPTLFLREESESTNDEENMFLVIPYKIEHTSEVDVNMSTLSRRGKF